VAKADLSRTTKATNMQLSRALVFTFP